MLLVNAQRGTPVVQLQSAVGVIPAAEPLPESSFFLVPTMF